MNIETASKKWGVSTNTVLKYIYNGYILNLSIEENEIIVPNISKPYIIKGKINTIMKLDYSILKSLESIQYFNYKIAGVTDDLFKERLLILEEEKKIYRKTDTPNFASNIDFAIASLQTDDLKKDISLITINPTLQVGLMNIKK